MTDISSIPSLAVPANTVTNVSWHSVYGDNSAIGTTFETITNLNADIVQIGEAAGDTVDVVSADANDTSAGTGARTVIIKGLDANHNPQEDTISLSGATPVATTNKYKFINEFYVASTGTGLTNAGALTLADVTGSDSLGLIEVSGYQMANCIWMVPAGHTGYVYGFWYDVDSAAAGAGDTDFAMQTIRTGFQGAIGSEVWRTVAKTRAVVNDNDVVSATGGNDGNPGFFVFPGGPLVLPEKTIVRLAAKSPAAVGVQGGFNIAIQGSGAGTTTTVN